MGLPSADFVTDREQIAAITTNRAPELSPAPTAFVGELAGALAQVTQGIGGDVDQAGRDAVPATDSSSQGLDNWAIAVGISNGVGGYGPKGATFAQGFSAYLTGAATTAYLAGQQATAAGITLRLHSPVTIPGVTGSGQIQGEWDADPTTPASAGTAGNLPAGTQLQLVSPPPTSDSTITLTTGPSVPGLDEESDASVLLRIQTKMQRPPNGGNGTDYKTWAENALDATGNPITGITAYVYPNYYGDGLPLVVCLQAGSGTTRQADALDMASISAYINGTATSEGQDPAGATATVSTGFMPVLRELICVVRCVSSKAAYNFDWARGLTPLSVNSITTTGLPVWATNVGANAVLELSALAPISLKDAIAAGATPRIQVDTQNGLVIPGPVIPEQWKCAPRVGANIAYLDAAGRTSLALTVPNVANFAAWVHPGNSVYAGGPIVLPVAEAILATIDRNGPSRASGLADRAQIWSDTVGISTLSTAAESTLDADGVTRLVSRCIASGVLIGIGGGSAPIVQDVPASDNTVAGPEVLFAGRILVVD